MFLNPFSEDLGFLGAQETAFCLIMQLEGTLDQIRTDTRAPVSS